MKLGLLGGTFDPIHVGHLDVARAAKLALDLDVVWLVPARVPSHRYQPVASAAHRFAMAALAIESEDGYCVSDIEMETMGPSYTVETLGALAARPDMAGVTLHFIVGADAFRGVPSWRAYPHVLDLAHFIVVSRPGWPVGTLSAALPDLAPRMHTTPCTAPSTPSIFLVDAPTSPVSSTAVRQALGAGRLVPGLVPDRVQAYITKHQLYASSRETHQG